jgi:hypothetical protein
LIDALREPFALGHITVQVDVSIAIGCGPIIALTPRNC